MNLTQLLRYLRYELLDNPGLPCVWGDTEDAMEDSLLRYLNEAMKFMNLRKMKADPSFFTDSRTVAELGLTFGTQGNWHTLDLPEYMLSLRKIEMLPAGELDAEPLGFVQLSESDGSSLFSSLHLPKGSATHFTLLGRRKLGIGGPVDGITLRLYFVRRPPDLVRMKAISGDVDTFRVDVTTSALRGSLVGRSHYYVGGRVQVISSDDLPPQEEIRDIVAYAPPPGFTFPTFRFDVDEDFSDTIEADDVIEVIPSLEEEYHELLAYLAAQRAYHREGEISNALAQSETVKDLWKQFLSSSSHRQVVSSRIPGFDRTM